MSKVKRMAKGRVGSVRLRRNKAKMPSKKEPCSICHTPYTGFGNNASPVNNGRCCDHCNWTVVLPARINLAYGPDPLTGDGNGKE